MTSKYKTGKNRIKRMQKNYNYLDFFEPGMKILFGSRHLKLQWARLLLKLALITEKNPNQILQIKTKILYSVYFV